MANIVPPEMPEERSEVIIVGSFEIISGRTVIPIPTPIPSDYYNIFCIKFCTT